MRATSDGGLNGPQRWVRSAVERFGTGVAGILERGQWNPTLIPDMRGKVVVVTGASTGMGFASAQKLAECGAKVILVGRTLESAQDAVKRITVEAKQGAPPLQLEALHCDFRALKNVVKLVDEIKAKTDHIDILINMAGVFYPGPYDKTDDGIEQTLGINYYAPALLTLGVLDLLKVKPRSRVVIMASLAEGAGQLDWDNLKGDKYRDSGFIPYGTSKLYALTFGHELSKRVPEIDVFAVHPGLVASPLHKKSDPRYPANAIIKPATFFFGQSWSRGAYSTLFAATEPSLTGRHWGFFAPNILNLWPTTERKPLRHSIAYNPVTSWRLFEETVDILRENVGQDALQTIPHANEKTLEFAKVSGGINRK